LQRLTDAGLLDTNGDIKVHNWDDRQPNSDASRDRMRASRERYRPVTEPLPTSDSNALEQNREEKRRTEQSATPPALPPRQQFFDTQSRGKEIGALIDEAKAHGYELDASHVGGILKRYPKGAVWDALLKAQGDKAANYESRMEGILSGSAKSGSQPTRAGAGTTTTPADRAAREW
ncbi:hypothetical protein LCGC14_2471530, partial [marine sediment metagenome]